MIAVVNKRKHQPTTNDIYIGRPSPLGNPYSHLFIPGKNLIKVANRDEAVRLYSKWFANQMSGDSEVKKEINRLVSLYRTSGKLNLVCWCAPSNCHGQVIKAKIEELVK